MSTSSKRKVFDALVSRILFFELGAMVILVAIYVFLQNPITGLLTSIFCLGLLLIGLCCIYICFGLDNKKVKEWASQTGNHWAMFIFVLLAYGFANAIRRWK